MNELLRIDPRDEDDLYWRFNFAHGEVLGLRARTYDVIYEPIGELPFECGPVYVGSQQVYQVYEMGLGNIAAAHRERFVDKALAKLPKSEREVLWLLFGAPVNTAAFPLYVRPDLSSVAAMCNLIPHCPRVHELHRKSRSWRPLLKWLAWAVKSSQKVGGAEVSTEVRQAVDAMALRATALFRKAKMSIWSTYNEEQRRENKSLLHYSRTGRHDGNVEVQGRKISEQDWSSGTAWRERY